MERRIQAKLQVTAIQQRKHSIDNFKAREEKIASDRKMNNPGVYVFDAFFLLSRLKMVSELS